MKPPSTHTENYDAYSDWRTEELASQWRFFSDADIAGKDVLDFGSGFGNLTFYLSRFAPKRIVGIELEDLAFEQADKIRAKFTGPYGDRVSFVRGAVDRVPFEDASFDTILAFDCVEHILEPETIFREWQRILRPGGKVLIWWSPYRGPYGPHMEAIIPVPWAHVLFGERAMLKTAARIYESDTFVPRPWHFDAEGKRKPNVWKQWSTFKEQGHLNQLTLTDFRALAEKVGLPSSRLEPHGFSGSLARRAVSEVLVRMPVLGEWMTSFYIIECTKR
jgi:SAM-dependent methyltransferase